MSIAVKISDELVQKARMFGKVFHRSTAGQVEYWAKIGHIAEEHPDLPYSFIKDTLLGLEALQSSQVEPYIFIKRTQGSRS